MEGVAARDLEAVEPGWGHGFREAVGGYADLPFAFVDQSVVVAAQEDAVGQVGAAAAGPVHYMVAFGLAPVSRTVGWVFSVIGGLVVVQGGVQAAGVVLPDVLEQLGFGLFTGGRLAVGVDGFCFE